MGTGASYPANELQVRDTFGRYLSRFAYSVQIDAPGLCV